MHIPNPHIFKEYDIRGIVATDMPRELIVALGKAYGTTLRRSGALRTIVGRDCRLTSDALRDALIEGICATGCTVLDIGVCTTPMLYFALHHHTADGGVMITGSHNDSPYNGFKIAIGKSTIYGSAIQDLKMLIERDDFVSGAGAVSEASIIDAYGSYLTHQCSCVRPLTVVVDGGNGTGGYFAAPILERMGCHVVRLYCDMDGNFPHHHPDPSVPATLKDMQSKVVDSHADIGIAFDGDGDRIGVVNDKGEIVFADMLMILYAKEILSRVPGSTFISEAKSSHHLYNQIAAMGGKAIMWKTGHSLIKAKMQETGAVMAGELTGHMFFKDRFLGFDDAIYAACRLVEIVAKEDRALSLLLSHIPKSFSTPEMRIDCPDGKKKEVIEHIKQALLKKGYRFNDVDGARVTFDNGWAIVRASNTQPALTVRCEADTQHDLDCITAFIRDLVAHSIESEHDL